MAPFEGLPVHGGKIQRVQPVSGAVETFEERTERIMSGWSPEHRAYFGTKRRSVPFNSGVAR